MKFKGYGIVWDATNDRPLVEFTDGVCETTDKKVSKKLTDLGYEGIEEVEETPVNAETPVESAPIV